MRLKNFVKQLLSVFVLGGTIYYVYLHLGDFQEAPVFNLTAVVPLIIVSLGFQFLQALIFKYQTQLFSLNLSVKHWFGLAATSVMYNLLFPARGGLFARGYFLQKKYQFQYSHYAGLMLIMLILGLFITSFASLLAHAWNIYEYAWLNKSTFTVALAAMATSTFVFLFILIVTKKRIGNLVKNWARINSLWDGFSQISSQLNLNRKALFLLTLSFLTTVLVMSARLLFSGSLLGLDLTLPLCIIIQTMVGLSVFVSFTPGNLGVKEGIIVALLTSQGIAPETAIIVAGVDRLCSALVILLFGVPFHFVLIKDNDL